MIEDNLKGARACRARPQISHLLFADDSIFFVEATMTRAMGVKNILHEYERCSGQCINFDKSTIFLALILWRKIEDKLRV